MKKGNIKLQIVLPIFVIILVGICILFFQKNAITTNSKSNDEILDFEEINTNINLEEILNKNISKVKKEEIKVEEIDLEYTTIYEQDSDLAKGTFQIMQEGKDGKQQKIIKTVYENEEKTDEEITMKILQSSVDKIVKIGTGNFKVSDKVKKGDKLYVTSYTISVKEEPSIESKKIYTLHKDEEVILIEVKNNWYKVSFNNYEGWVEKECLTSENPIQIVGEDGKTYSKSQLLSRLSFNMRLNTPSGLTLEQFKKVLSYKEKDVNGIFEANAQYFYYIEKQYNINGIFVAAVAIHESNWGTSKISLNKKNLFGYGAYDRNPYDSAYTFNEYSEGIDLLARVFVKYYLNTPGTKIYDGQLASGAHYNGATLSGVNVKYATDKNWANGVYSWMKNLYNRI